ncbi:MAG: GNAT family N-acetyltransferase [Candidatus Nanohalobium sp.]
MKSKFLEKGNVVLRPIEKDDAEFLREFIKHRDVRDTIGKPPRPVNLKQEEEFIEATSEDDDAVKFLIEYKDERAGEISLNELEKPYRKGELGISIHPDFHGQGIGSTAVQLVTRYAFETLNRHKVRGGYLEGNEASKRIMEKAGMQQEGRDRHYKYVDGEWKDVIWMSILEEEYFE